MNYLLRDKRRNRKGPWTIALGVVVVLVVIFILNSQFAFAGRFFSFVGWPFWAIKEETTSSFVSLASFFESKNTLAAENAQLTAELSSDEDAQTNAELISQENDYLKGVFGRATNKNLVLAAVLQGPGSSLYDTLVLDVGSNDNIQAGDVVLADAVTPIGYISQVYGATSVAELYSSPGQTTPVVIDGINLQTSALGLGGGNFQIQIPQNINIGTSTAILLPGLSKQIVGTIGSIESDAAHSTQTIYFRSDISASTLTAVFIQE